MDSRTNSLISKKRSPFPELDRALEALRREASRLPLLAPRPSPSRERENRERLLRGDKPRNETPLIRRVIDARSAFRTLEDARKLAEKTPLAALLSPRFDELELEFAILEALGTPRLVRPLARRRWSCHDRPLETSAGPIYPSRIALSILEELEPDPEPPSVDAQGAASIVRELSSWVGFPVSVVISDELSSRAAAGDRTVYLAHARFGAREARRLAVHEVLGHLVSAANALRQPTRALVLGTARSFEDQEGVAVYLEERAGLLGPSRLRTLAARYLAAESVFDGASYGETAQLLHRRHGLSAEESLTIAGRVHRGGGLAREGVYLPAYLRVRTAIVEGGLALRELQRGRVSLGSLGELRRLEEAGVLHRPAYTPSLAFIFGTTGPGTSFETSPPSLVTSLHSPDAT